ncbi:hypothetical protein BOX15_Mlig006883g3 [Macrostomum lignano]|uniref:Uncharacterized protein n=1 Tax=Macrostomum lignano TaxID=282301 RepID=A0A267ESQ3_9PLAT|nr:hypothetical protein BOX15_Mlig006883g1 [Macrostomum lignano]PAA91883.1 hypothetical protein BOX15_Mlig006883g3 [Macrostomum lignano]
MKSVALLVLAVTFAAVACCLVQQVEARPRAAVAELLQSAVDSDRARELGDGGATTGDNGDFESEAALKDYLDRLQVYYAMVSRPRFGKRRR